MGPFVGDARVGERWGQIPLPVAAQGVGRVQIDLPPVVRDGLSYGIVRRADRSDGGEIRLYMGLVLRPGLLVGRQQVRQQLAEDFPPPGLKVGRHPVGKVLFQVHEEEQVVVHMVGPRREQVQARRIVPRRHVRHHQLAPVADVRAAQGRDGLCPGAHDRAQVF